MCVADLNKPTRALPFISFINFIVRLTFAQVQLLYARFFSRFDTYIDFANTLMLKQLQTYHVDVLDMFQA